MQIALQGRSKLAEIHASSFSSKCFGSPSERSSKDATVQKVCVVQVFIMFATGFDALHLSPTSMSCSVGKIAQSTEILAASICVKPSLATLRPVKPIMKTARSILVLAAIAEGFQPLIRSPTRYHGVPSLSIKSEFFRPSTIRLGATIERRDTAHQPTIDAPVEPNARRILGQPIPYSELTVGILAEEFEGENRVSQTPDSVLTLTKAGIRVLVQEGGEY